MKFNDADPPNGRPEVMQKLGSPQFLAELMRADVVRGQDEQTGNTFIVFGRSTLQSIKAANQSMDCYVIQVAIIQKTLELEALIAAVKVAKGYHEYEATTPQQIKS
jgi:hypothetical protein